MENTIKLSPSFSIPTRSIWSLVGFIAICGFGYLQFTYFLIPGFAEISSYNENPINVSSGMRLVWIPVITYTIIGAGTSLIINIFKKLKSFDEKGFFWGLVWGLVGIILELVAFSLIELDLLPIIGFTLHTIGFCGAILVLVFGFIGEFQ